ncbi:MAG TPA: hypothetical protein VM915_09745 [Verrucomicrobiae bacterium]|jgi:hypothetical protein|nr:hypothetical protein [Verrucomicrobiae bacterium]
MPVTHEIMRQIGLPEHEADPREFFNFMARNDYSHPVILADGSLAVVYRFVFTDAILIGLNPYGYEDRFCFSPGKARAALDEWMRNGNAEPQGWHRHPPTGRRRPDGDAAGEYVEF